MFKILKNISWFKSKPKTEEQLLRKRLETVRRKNESVMFINRIKYNFDDGMRLLVTKDKDTTKSDITVVREYGHLYKPYTIGEIMQFKNAEQRQIAMKYIDIGDFLTTGLFNLLDKQTITKKTTWCLENGDMQTIEYDDTYELYVGSLSKLNISDNDVPCHILKFKDTSTDRIYYCFIDYKQVCDLNRTGNPTAIDCIAWTITVPCNPIFIKEIVRQGDCIMCLVDKQSYDNAYKNIKYPRFINDKYHLTGKQYLELIKNES